MASPALLRSAAEQRLAQHGIFGAFGLRPRPELPSLSTGIAALDAELGGVPFGAITEIVAPPGISCGKQTLCLRLLAMAAEQRACAWIDAADSFDPPSAQAAGVKLENVLWVRCASSFRNSQATTRSEKAHHEIAGKKNALTPLEQAFQCADLVLGAGGFGLVVMDLARISPRMLRKVPLTTWFRFRALVEKLETALVVAVPCRVAASCSALCVRAQPAAAVWLNDKARAHARALAGSEISFAADGERGRKKPAAAAFQNSKAFLNSQVEANSKTPASFIAELRSA